MRVIFLDIDGVLNVISQGHDVYGSVFHKTFENNLRHIIDVTGAKIVISSSWRINGIDRMRAMWEYRGIAGEIIGVTPHEDILIKEGLFKYYDDVCRGDEIQYYLDKHPEISSYVIIDDDDDMLKGQMSRFVKTANNTHHPDCVDIGYGLTKKCAEQAINILTH